MSDIQCVLPYANLNFIAVYLSLLPHLSIFQGIEPRFAKLHHLLCCTCKGPDDINLL